MSIPDSADFDANFGFDSLNSEILIVDGPGDTTVRPARPILQQREIASRERATGISGVPIAPAPERPTQQSGTAS